MRQVWMNRKGEVDVLEVREVPRPEPGPGQVRVRVEAAGVNFADVMMRRGLYPDAPKLPAVAGYEVAGVVDAVGAEVEKKLMATRVVSRIRKALRVDLPVSEMFVYPTVAELAHKIELINWTSQGFAEDEFDDDEVFSL